MCTRACGLFAGMDLSLPSIFGACSVHQVKFLSQILLLTLLFTGTDIPVLLSEPETLYIFQETYGLFTYEGGCGWISLETSLLEVPREIRCANMY